MIYAVSAVLLLGQLVLGVGLLRLASRLREVRDTAMSALTINGEPEFDAIPAALKPGSTVPPEAGRRWRLWVVVPGARTDLTAALAERQQEDLGDFQLQVLTVEQLPARLGKLDESSLPAICMIDPDGTIQGAGRITSADEVIAFIDEGTRQGLGPAKEALAVG